LPGITPPASGIDSIRTGAQTKIVLLFAHLSRCEQRWLRSPSNALSLGLWIFLINQQLAPGTFAPCLEPFALSLRFEDRSIELTPSVEE
ncbi:MAG: hypothetical protein JXR85_01975, partial [Deltaproteobacteria bacterium]|nr:hypothetical protein [Deltaproteobacteria bacterium]